MGKFQHYWKELQRRHVVKAGLAYLVGAWLLVQVLSIVLPAFGMGQGWMKTTILILSIGFPIWLILAWIYDFSWGSIQKTEDVPFNPEDSRKKNIGLNRFIIGGLAIAVILLLVNTLRLSSKVNDIEGQYLAMEFTNSLAILPFDDLSPKQDQRYFSDGLARSIYDRLARSKDLKLISPTTSLQYRGKEISIEVIAEELGVRYVLEGSVQLFGNRFRASINLVDTNDGSTIWSKTFDDTLEDVLKTYDVIAKNVSSFLNITLVNPEVRQRKVDPEAYLLYLKAKDTLRRESYSRSSVIAADSIIKKSLEIDPEYGPSQITYALATFHKTIYWELMERPVGLAIAKEAAYKGIQLDPEDPWGYIWVSNVSWHERDMDSFYMYLKKAVETRDNDADLNMYKGISLDRTNRVVEAYQYVRNAAELSPKDNECNYRIAYHELYRGNYSEAILRFNKIDSDWIVWKIQGIVFAEIYGGEFEKAEERIKSLPPYLKEIAQVLLLSRQKKKDEARLALREFIAFNKQHPSYVEYAQSDNNHNWWIADLYSELGDVDKAFFYLDKAYPNIVNETEIFFLDEHLKPLYNDPRWDAYIDRLSEEFNYDFPHRPE